MAPRNRKTLRSKKRRSFPKYNVLRSTTMLYIIFILTLLDMIGLWINEDHESIFLFIIIAFIVYMQNKNMIFVLGIPLIFVTLLILLRTLFRGSHEGFFDYETYKAYDLQQWVKKYVQKDDNKYADFTENISDELGSLSEKVRNVLDNPMTDKEDVRDRYVNELKDFMLMIDIMPTDDPLYENDQVVYVRRMIRAYKRGKISNKPPKKDDEYMEAEDMEGEDMEAEGFNQTVKGLSKMMKSL